MLIEAAQRAHALGGLHRGPRIEVMITAGQSRPSRRPVLGYTARRDGARMFDSGFLTIGRIGRARVRVHWSTPIGVILFTGLRFAPGAWLGFVLVILIHELGHAAMVALSKHRVLSADVYALGGLCHWDGYPTPTERALIAWGGVLAQALAAIAALIVIAALGAPSSAFLADLAGAFLGPNLWMILVNLVPVPPLDGAEAWRIVPILASRRRLRRELAEKRARAVALEQRARPVSEEELAPMPDEVKRVLDRVMSEGRAQHEAEKKAK